MSTPLIPARVRRAARWATLTLALAAAGVTADRAAGAGPVAAEPAWLARLLDIHALTPAQAQAVRAVLARSPFIGQGNPDITRHPLSPEACAARSAGVPATEDSVARAVCGGPHMAPLFDPQAGQGLQDAQVCIDRYEFPDIPCEYPIVWVRASEAAQLCAAVGKRLCDAHEWEGACQGRLTPPDYRFDLAAGQAPATAVAAMARAHNAAHQGDKLWSYGPAYEKGVCAAASSKSPDCPGGSWRQCGSNTYPAGSFADCRSDFGVFDLHGNAAEHMNLPLDASQMASRGSQTLGHTEMKGSWFIFDRVYAHQDWCRWRAPYWHGSRVLAPKSHHNYHLGFRCCRTVATPG